MKKLTLIVTALFIVVNSFSQAPNWVWAKSAGGSASDYGFSVATDQLGNVYETGSFRSSSITFGSTTLTNASSGTDDMFLVKVGRCHSLHF